MALCPYCKKEIDGKNIKIDEIKGILKLSRAIYSCPHCNYVLGVGSNA